MGTKNNPKNRGKVIKKKTHNNKDVEPILYAGGHAGHGKYITGKYAGTHELIVDANNKPLPWESI
ncbi:MAG: hypothetical protein ACJA0S_001440 [Rickettsiales bacterium]|jgi:hypothetical protein